MMDQVWRAILARYGQPVAVLSGEKDTPVRALLQPLREKGEQTVPSPLGLRREDRFLYMGPPDVPLTPRKTQVAWLGQRYEVQTAHPVTAGSIHHWWAVLRPADRREADA